MTGCETEHPHYAWNKTSDGWNAKSHACAQLVPHDALSVLTAAAIIFIILVLADLSDKFTRLHTLGYYGVVILSNERRWKGRLLNESSR